MLNRLNYENLSVSACQALEFSHLNTGMMRNYIPVRSPLETTLWVESGPTSRSGTNCYSGPRSGYSYNDSDRCAKKYDRKRRKPFGKGVPQGQPEEVSQRDTGLK